MGNQFHVWNRNVIGGRCFVRDNEEDRLVFRDWHAEHVSTSNAERSLKHNNKLIYNNEYL